MQIRLSSMVYNVGTMDVDASKVASVRVLANKTANKTKSGLGARVSILQWADSIGMDWVNKTVKSYRKGVK
jgi:hypothetical protein